MPDINAKKRRTKITPKKILLVILVGLALWLPRVLGLDRPVTIDEPRWLMRSANFYRALYLGNLEDTFQREHPGVTVTWAGTAGFLSRFPGYVKVAPKQLTSPTKLHKFLQEYKIPALDVLVAGRFFVVLAIVGTSLVAFLYATKLLGAFPALIAFLLIAFDPYTIALSRLLHLDGLVSALMLLSLLAFMSYLYHDRQRLDLIVSGIAAGLGWLTKSPALFLAPFLGLLVGIELLKTWRTTKQMAMKQLWQASKPLLIWFGIGCIVFITLWPAMWVNPIENIQRIFSQAADYAIEGNLNVTFFNGKIYDSGESVWYFYPITYLWRTTPAVLIGIGLAILYLIFHKKQPSLTQHTREIWIFFLFAILYTIFMSIGGKKSDRYLLPIFGPLILIAGLGWYFALQVIQSVLGKYFSATVLRIGSAVLIALIVLVQFIGVLQTYPYYFNYYNPLVGGSKEADQVMMIGWGEGLDQAAQYLNSIPGAEKMRVASWYREGAFSYYFKGTALEMENAKTIADFRGIDYVVLYIHQWQRQLPTPEILAFFAQITPEYTVQVGDFVYARVYNMHENTIPE